MPVEPVTSPEPRRVFKYLPEKHARSLLAIGQLRVGTLYDFRSMEHKKGIADPKEGTKRVEAKIEYASGYLGLGDMSAVRAFNETWNGIFPTESPDFWMEGMTLANNFKAPDCYVFCASNVCSSRVMSEFEGADTCLEIADWDGFLNALTGALIARVPIQNRCGTTDVVYQAREETWNEQDWGTSPIRIKEPEFAGQHEVRAVWIPSPSPIQPLIIEDSRLTKFVREIKTLPDG